MVRDILINEDWIKFGDYLKTSHASIPSKKFLSVNIYSLFSSIAECCSTPYSLLGLVFTVSFVALGVLTLCKFYLQGYRAFMNDPAMNR